MKKLYTRNDFIDMPWKNGLGVTTELYKNHLSEKIKLLEINLIKPMDLTTRKNVKKYLDISESTLINMMKDGRLKQGKHFIKEFKNNRFKIIFVESAIIKLKELKQ